MISYFLIHVNKYLLKSVRMDHVISYIIYQSTCLKMVIAWSLSINCLLLLLSRIISILDKESQRHILNWKNWEINKRGLFHTIPSLTWTVWGKICVHSEYSVFRQIFEYGSTKIIYKSNTAIPVCSIKFCRY